MLLNPGFLMEVLLAADAVVSVFKFGSYTSKILTQNHKDNNWSIKGEKCLELDTYNTGFFHLFTLLFTIHVHIKAVICDDGNK